MWTNNPRPTGQPQQHPIAEACTGQTPDDESAMLQVTPVFGILNDLAQRRAAAAEGQGGGVPVPAKVVFVFSAAQKNELALLRRPLIDDAMCASDPHACLCDNE